MPRLSPQRSTGDLLATDACAKLAAGLGFSVSSCCCCKPPTQRHLVCPKQILQIQAMLRQTQCPQHGPCVAPVHATDSCKSILGLFEYPTLQVLVHTAGDMCTCATVPPAAAGSLEVALRLLLPAARELISAPSAFQAVYLLVMCIRSVVHHVPSVNRRTGLLGVKLSCSDQAAAGVSDEARSTHFIADSVASLRRHSNDALETFGGS